MPFGGKYRKGKTAQLPLTLRDDITGKLLIEDIKLLEEYEQLSKMVEVRNHLLKKAQNEEIELSGINKLNLREKWRSIMRSTKVESLRKDIESLSQLQEKEIERKDSIISILLSDLSSAEEQFQSSHNSHMIRIKKLMEIHSSRLFSLENEFKNDLKSISDEFETEKKIILSNHNQERQELASIVETISNESRDRENQDKHEHETLREEMRNKNVDDIHMLRHDLLNLIEILEEDFDQAYHNYKKKTHLRNQEYNALTQKDAEIIGEIKEQKNLIEKLGNNLQFQRKKKIQNERECSNRNNALRSEKDAMLKHYAHLKEKMKKCREIENKKLTELSKTSRNSLKSNQKFANQAENIVKLAELSRKLEITSETVSPFYESTISTESDLDSGNNSKEIQKQVENMKKHGESYALNEVGLPISEYHHLKNFHKKFNKVLLDKINLQEEKKKLEEENNDLKSILKQYLDGITISNDAVDKPNSLLVINGKMNLNQTQRPIRKLKSNEMPVFIEANNVINTYSKQSK